MKALTKFSVVAAAAATSAILGAGSASAVTVTVHDPGTAGSVVPTTNYTLCGTVSTDESNPSSGNPLSSNAAAIEGAEVTGQLYNVFNGTVGSPMTATSGTDGTFCFTGTDTMVPVITLGGKVALSVNPSTIGTRTAKLPYGGTITALQFLNHKVSGLESAANLNIAFD